VQRFILLLLLALVVLLTVFQKIRLVIVIRRPVGGKRRGVERRGQ